MKVTANVEVMSRLLASANQRTKGKTSRSQVSIGRKPGDSANDIFLMICTQQDRSGIRYKLKQNVEMAFTKFVNEGKATVRLKDPLVDICFSKVDPIQLKSFLNVLRRAANGEMVDGVALSTLVPATAKQVAGLKTKLSVNSRKEYPITEGFPSSLESLQIVSCTLKTIDSRIFKLWNLTVLDLSNNHLKVLPNGWETLKNLVELRLASNQIEDIPKGLCSGTLQKRLVYLDLSSNRLCFLRPYFCDLQSLGTLKLDGNQLAFLPSGIGKLRALCTLTVSNNKLKTLPSSFAYLSLQTLDLCGNPFMQDGPASAIERLAFPSLLECVGRVIRRERIPYTPENVGPLTEYLDAAKPCRCGRFSFTSNVHYLLRLDLRHVAATVTAIDSLGRMHVPCEGFLCSLACYEIYKVNPLSTSWRPMGQGVNKV